MKSIFTIKRMAALAFICLSLYRSIGADVYAILPFKTYHIDENRINWGSENKGVKAGVAVLVVTNHLDKLKNGIWCIPYLQFKTNDETQIYMLSTNTATNCFVQIRNMMVWSNTPSDPQPAWSRPEASIGCLLPFTKNFQLRLTDTKQQEVKRKDSGETLRHTFLDNPKFECNRSAEYVLESGGIVGFMGNTAFRLDDFFDLTWPSDYHLQIHMRIFLCYAHAKPEERWEPLYLPSMNVDFTIPNQASVTH